MDTGPFGISEADSTVLLEAFDNSDLFLENKELLAGLREISTVIKVGPAWTLLAQGELNVSLYVLLQGSVEVFVDEKLVAHLRHKGDFLGEMGVITGQPNSATVVTATPCEFLCIDIENSQGGEPNPILRQALHSLFARALANKLVITNERAKKFEAASEELRRAHDALHEANLELEEKVRERTLALVQKGEELEAQNAEIGASMQKLQELVLNKDKTFSSLNMLRSDYLEPLQALLTEPDHNPEVTDQAKRRLVARIGDLLENLRPMTDVHESEVALRHKRVVLAASNKKLQRIAKIALLGTGVDLEILQPDTVPSALLDGTVDIVLTDVEHLEAVQESHEKNPDMEVVFMTPDSIEVYLDEVRKHAYLSNIVSFNVEDRDFTTKNILTTVSKILNRDIFGLEKYLLWGVDVEQRTLSRSDQRRELIDGMSEHLTNFGLRKRTISRAALVCEELLMNALYDAPIDDTGTPLFNHLSRREPVVLPGSDVATLRYACDGMLLAVSVSDPYGSLHKDTILEYLASCYEGRAGEASQDDKRGGAGRGLYQIVETSDLVVFNVRQGLRSEAIALFNLEVTPASQVTEPSFHFFTS